MNYQVMPELTAEEYQSLKDDIAERGVMIPIEYDESGNVLDGYHRSKVCAELGITEYPRVIRLGMTETQKRTHARKLNMARRHLTQEQKRGLIREQLADTPEVSDRQIATGLGVSNSTVSQARKEMVADNQLCESHTSVGADGKEYPRKPVSVFNPTGRELTALQNPAVVEKLESGTASVIEAERAIKEDARELERVQNAEKVIALANPLDAQGLFQTIVIDPPWDWGDEGDVNQLGRAKPDYATMPIQDIEALPISKIADKNCHLYLWATNRSLPKAFRLIDAWGFRYITCITWVKPSYGMGNYFRGSTEQVLFAIKGSQPLKRKDAGTHFEAPRGKGHSAKPDAFYDLVSTCSHAPFIDIFGRKKREGWTVWGENDGS